MNEWIINVFFRGCYNNNSGGGGGGDDEDNDDVLNKDCRWDFRFSQW